MKHLYKSCQILKMGKDQKLEFISMSCKEITNEYYKSFEFTKIAHFNVDIL